MREFRLIFPTYDKSGLLRSDIAWAIGLRLVKSFGGFTRTESLGCYRSTNGDIIEEPVYIFDVATHSNSDMVRAFAVMAASEIKREMDQELVYFRNITGIVELL